MVTASDTAFLTALVFQFIILAVVLLLFCWIRPRFRVAYSPMCFGDNAAELPGDGFFEWIRPTFAYSLDWIHANRGLDSVMYISFLQSCMRLFGVFFIVSLVILFPVFGTGENHDLEDDDREYVEGMDMLSMSNLSNEGSKRFWAPALVLIGFTIAFWAMVYNDHKRYTKFRVQAKKNPTPENFVIKVRNPVYPENLVTVDEKKKWLFDYFNALFPNDIVAVTLIANSPKLEEVRVEEILCQRGLEKALAIKRKTGEEPQHKTGFLGLVGEQVTSIPYFVEEIKKKRDEAHEIMNDKELPLKPVAWVTFKSIRKAQQCAHVSLNRNPTAFLTSPAPEFRDIFWPNLGTPTIHRYVRTIVSTGITVFILFFYIIPITFVQGLTNLTELSDTSGMGWLKPLIDGAPAIVAFLEGVLPPLVLIIFMILIIPIFRFLSAQEGYETISEQSVAVLNKYFTFLVVNVFLVSTLAGAILSKLTAVLADPTSIISVLASSVPAQGNFFMLYIIAKISGVGIGLLNPGRLIVPPLFQKFLSKTEREFREVEAPPEYAYDVKIANDLLIVVLSITYSVMYPLILALAFVYFGLNLLVTRYNVIFAFEQKWDGKGILWPTIFVQITSALIICQLTTIGVLAINKFPGTVILFPLLPLTAFFCYRTLESFHKPSEQGASDEAHIVLDFELLNDLKQRQEANQEYPQMAEVNEATGINDTNPNDIRLHRHPPILGVFSQSQTKPVQDEENQEEQTQTQDELDYSPMLVYYVQPPMQPMTLIPQRPSRVAQFRKHQPL